MNQNLSQELFDFLMDELDAVALESDIRCLVNIVKKYSFQKDVDAWMAKCFGRAISKNVAERNYRFLEEAIELVQSKGCTVSEAHQLVDYVFNRPSGEPGQEVGGVMVTLAALCSAAGLDLNQCAEAELERVWANMMKIKVKQANKPIRSPLPQPGVVKGVIEELDRYKKLTIALKRHITVLNKRIKDGNNNRKRR